MEELIVIVGLGNPGAKYENTLHNAGYMVVDEIARQQGVTFKQHKSPNLVAEFKTGYGTQMKKVVLAKACSYMNESGGPVSALLKFYKVAPENLLVIHDELDIDKYSLRMKIGGGEGGHNGLKSISRSLGTKDYMRLRYGIGRPAGRTPVVDFVLSNFPKKEEADKQICINEAAEAAMEVVTSGFDKAQHNLHTLQRQR